MHKVPRSILIGFAILLLIIGLVGLVAWELLSSAVEAKYLAKTAQKLTWQIRPGPSDRIRYPGPGPYDVRLGYSKLPDYLERLQKSGWQIDEQARVSRQLARVAEAKTMAFDLTCFTTFQAKRRSRHSCSVGARRVITRLADSIATAWATRC